MRRFLPLLPPILLVVVASAQFGIAHTTALSQWKLGGFGMFSTSDEARTRVLRVHVETDTGTFVVPEQQGSLWTRNWPRSTVLREAAREAVCKNWRFVPLDSTEIVVFPAPEWELFYSTSSVREQTRIAGVAVLADTANTSPGAPRVRAARALVVHPHLDTSGPDRSTLVPETIASEQITIADAGCVPT